MATTSSEDLNKIIEDLDDAIDTVHNPNSALSNHRKTVDLYRAIRKVAQLEKELETDTGANIHGKVIAFFNKASLE